MRLADYPDQLYGMRVVVSEHTLVRRWVFPPDRFLSCEESDVRWASVLGYGHWLYEPGIYQAGNTLMVHPSLYERIREGFRGT